MAVCSFSLENQDDLDVLLQDFSYLKSLEYKDRIPSKVSKKLLLPDTSCKYVVNERFKDTGEVVFKRMFKRPIARRCFQEFLFTTYFKMDPVAAHLMRFLNRIKDISSDMADAAHKEVEDICEEYLTSHIIGQVPGLWQDEKLRQTLTEHRVHLARKSADVQKKKSSEAEQPGSADPCGVKVSAISGIFTPFASEARSYLSLQPWEAFLRSNSFTRYCQWKQLELNMRVTERDFDIHRILGRGGFGEVYGCRKRDTGKMFAMKQLDKKRLKEKGQEMTALHERNVLAEMNSKFVTNLKYAFQSNVTLYLILDLMEGGDLSFHLKRVGGRFTEDVAKFYAAEILLGLSHIHSRGMIYRDLKPANVLLDAHGHARISDLGLVRDTQKTMPTSECGTHGYMAPEVLKPDVPYGLGADWFSLGCTVYEFLVGVTPFFGSTSPGQRPRTQDVDRRTLMGVVQYPASLPAAAKDFLSATLKVNPDERLGCVPRNLRASNPKAIQQHAWFNDDIDWQALLDHKVVPKIKPLHGQVNAKEVHEIDRMPYASKVKITAEDNIRYRNFDHVMSHQWQEEVLPMFEMISTKADAYDRSTQRRIERGAQQPDIAPETVVLQGYMRKLSHGFMKQWNMRYIHLFRDRIESRREQRHAPRRVLPFKECALRVVEGREYDERTLIFRMDDVEYCFKPAHVVDTTLWVRAVVMAFEAATGKTADITAEDLRRIRDGHRRKSDLAEQAQASGSPVRSVTPRERTSDSTDGMQTTAQMSPPATPTHHAAGSSSSGDAADPGSPTGHRASTRKSLYLSPKNMQRHHTHDDDEAASLRMMLDDVDAAVGPSRSAEDNVFGDDTDHSSDGETASTRQPTLHENTLVEHNML